MNQNLDTIPVVQFFWLRPDNESVFNALRALASAERT
jgi:hypothetical protein